MPKRTKKPDLVLELIEALADVIASRVAANMVETQKPPPMPERVPIWLMGPKPPKGARRQRSTAAPAAIRAGTPSKTDEEATIERSFREIGMVRMGDPGYRELLDKHLVNERARQAEMAARTQLRKVARLVRKLVEDVGSQRS